MKIMPVDVDMSYGLRLHLEKHAMLARREREMFRQVLELSKRYELITHPVTTTTKSIMFHMFLK